MWRTCTVDSHVGTVLCMSTRAAGLAWGAGVRGEGEPGECFLKAAAVVVVVWSHCVIVHLHLKDDVIVEFE